jgi:hypothetical protein
MGFHSFLVLFGLITFNNIAFSNDLKIHVIEPRFRTDWSSPSSLVTTSALNSSGDDYAPIGHFAVEVNCKTPHSNGTRHIISGMERKSKVESRQITLKEKLGLGSLIYPFEGALQTSKTSIKEITLARRDRRLKTLIIPTSEARCQAMLDFIDMWIQSGSYNVYGGGKDVTSGEGAGCADFAMEIFKIATNTPPPFEWIAEIQVPVKFLGDGKSKQVNFAEILTRTSWARPNEKSINFRIADANLVIDWINKRAPSTSEKLRYMQHIFPVGFMRSSDDLPKSFEKEANELLESPEAIERFRFQYPTTISPKELWRKIKIN